MVRVVLERELQVLKNLLLDMAKATNEMLSTTMTSFDKLDEELAQKVIKFDEQIDYYEHMVNLIAFEIIALQQPVAKDLRFIVSAIEIARNLERLADQTVNIAERVPFLSKFKEQLFNCKINILKMAKEALFMLETSINTFLEEDINNAKKVIKYDDIVDQYKKDFTKQIKECIKQDSSLVDIGIEYIVVVENLERVADLACNIAEAVIFTVEGKIPKLQEKIFLSVREILNKELPVFNYLLKHAKLITECMERLTLALEAYIKKDKTRLEEIMKHIIEIEREADKIKTNIRGHLPKGLVLPVEKFEVFLYLKEQDAIADSAERILTWLSFKEISFSPELAQKIETLLVQSLKPLIYFEDMILHSQNFLVNWDEDSRTKAKELIRKIRYEEFLTKELGNQIKKYIFENVRDPLEIFYLLKLIDLIINISHSAENAADLMRAMIAK